MNPAPRGTDGADGNGRPSDLPVMQDDQHPLERRSRRLVLAETQEQADHAASLIRVTLRGRAGGHLVSGGDRTRAPQPRTILGRAAQRSRSAMPRRPWPPRRIGSTSPTGPRGTTTTRSSRTRSPWPGTARSCTVHDSQPRACMQTAWSLGGRCSGLRRIRCTSRRRSWAAGSAANALWQSPDPRGRGGQDWPGARCGWRCRAKGSTAWSAAAPPPSSAWRSVPESDGTLRRADPYGRRGDDRAQHLPRAVHPCPRMRLYARPTLYARRSRWRTWTCLPTPSCGRPGSRSARFALECADR